MGGSKARQWAGALQGPAQQAAFQAQSSRWSLKRVQLGGLRWPVMEVVHGRSMVSERQEGGVLHGGNLGEAGAAGRQAAFEDQCSGFSPEMVGDGLWSTVCGLLDELDRLASGTGSQAAMAEADGEG